MTLKTLNTAGAVKTEELEKKEAPIVDGAVPTDVAGEKVEGEKVAGKKPANTNELSEKGLAIIAGMSEEERANIGSKSSTLHLIHQLGLDSQKSSRKFTDGTSKPWPLPVGVKLKTDIDIEVPVLPVTVNKSSVVKPEEIGSRAIKAGEMFDLTLFEFMYLMVRDEYSGLLTYDGDPEGAFLVAKVSNFLKNENKLPTPTIRLKKSKGSSKENILSIDEKGADGQWKIIDAYAEKFGDLLKKKTVSRSGNGAGGSTKTKTPAVSKPTAAAVALKTILLNK